MKSIEKGVKGKGNKPNPEQKTKGTTTKWYDKKIVRVPLKGLGGIVLGIIIGCSSSFLTQVLQDNDKSNFQQSVVNNLCIGTNEEYANSVLGYPFLKNINEKTNMTDCFYKIDGAIVRLFFENNSAKGIFITVTDRNAIGRFMFKKYSLTDNKKLGTFTFEDIDAENDGNYFLYSSLGTTFYIEEYFLGRVFSDYNNYFAILPYGIFIVPNETNKNEAEHYSREAEAQMGGYYPNTIGITDRDYMEKVCAMILDIDRFDYRSLNIYDEEMENYYESPLETEEESTEEDISTVNEPTEFEESLQKYFEESLQKYLDEVYYKDSNEEDYNEEDYNNDEISVDNES